MRCSLSTFATALRRG